MTPTQLRNAVKARGFTLKAVAAGIDVSYRAMLRYASPAGKAPKVVELAVMAWIKERT